MQENENHIYSLMNYIDSKKNDNDYQSIMKECDDLQEDINNELLKKSK